MCENGGYQGDINRVPAAFAMIGTHFCNEGLAKYIFTLFKAILPLKFQYEKMLKRRWIILHDWAFWKGRN